MNETVPGLHFHSCLPEWDWRAVYCWYKLAKKSYTKLSVQESASLFLGSSIVSDIMHLADVTLFFFFLPEAKPGSPRKWGMAFLTVMRDAMFPGIGGKCNQQWLEEVHCVSSFLMLHRQEVLMTVWLESKNCRIRVCLCHWPWANNYISLDICYNDFHHEVLETC